MNRLKYMFSLLLLLLGVAARGQDFNPVSPAEPSALWRLQVQADPVEAATVTGSGKYAAGRNVSLRATVSSPAWRFVNWTNAAGEEVSTNANFTYVMPQQDETLTAHYQPYATSTITLNYDPPSAGQQFSLTGGGLYAVGATVTIKASTYSNWTFQNWTRKNDGAVMSTSTSFTYETTVDDVEFVAHYKFTPGSNPAEPSQTKASHRVYFSANPSAAGSFNKTSGFSVREDENYSISAYTSTNYQFQNWTRNGEVVSSSSTYSGKMGTEDVTLVANYIFNPSSPSNPGAGTQQRFTLYGQTVSLYQGETMLYPVFLENTSAVRSLNFQLLLPEGITADAAHIQTTGRTSAFTAVGSLDGQVLTVELSGGSQVSDVNGAIVQIPVMTTASAVEGTFDIPFGETELTRIDGSLSSVSTRRGQVIVSVLDEGDLQAQFSVDRQMNRVQFTNLSTEGCKSYLWDFGDGETSTDVNPMHIYAEPGTYAVKLTARGVFAVSEAEQSIIINAPSTWTAEGDYTLDRNGYGVRNFESVHEALSLLSRCTPTGPIVVAVGDDGVYDMDATTEEDLHLVDVMTNRLTTSGYALRLTGADENNVSIVNIQVAESSEALLSGITFLKEVYAERVQVSLNGVDIDADILRNIADQTVCAETQTAALPLSQVSTSARMSVEWSASVSTGSPLAAYQVSGTGDLPTMSIKNTGMTAATISYNISYKLDGVTAYTCIHRIMVRPLTSQKVLEYSFPSDGAQVVYGNQTLRWTDLSTIATDGYTLNLKRTDQVSEIQHIELSRNTYQLDCIPGASYEWQVVAHGTCDDLEGPVQTFTVRKLADLSAQITAPATAKAQNVITLKATVTNVGEGITLNTSWTDAVYSSATNEGIDGATRLYTRNHSGALASGESYEFTYDVTVPDASEGQIYYYLVTDINKSEREVDETNNTVASNAVLIASNYVDEADYAVLKRLYQTTQGEDWTVNWDIENPAISSTTWSGVIFDNDGRVTAIDLHQANLSGTLPVEVFSLPSLASVNLSGNHLTGDLGTLFGQLAENELTIEYLNISDNEFTGNLSAVSEKLPSLKTLLAARNKISEVKPTLPNTITTLNIEGQDLHEIVTLNYSSLFTSPQLVPTVLTYRHPSGYSNQTVYLSDRWTGEDISWYAQLNWNQNGNNQIAIYSTQDWCSGLYTYPRGTVVQASIGSSSDWNKRHRFQVAMDFTLGDVNFDMQENISDLQTLINYAMTYETYTRYLPFNRTAADINADDVVNVQDVVAEVNILLDQYIEPVLAKRLANSRDANPSADGDEYGAEAILEVKNGQLILHAPRPVAALDLSLTSNRVKWGSATKWFTHAERGNRTIFYSLFGDLIPSGDTVLADYDGDVSSAMLVDTAGQPISLAIVSDNQFMGINGNLSDDGSRGGSVYDLQGRKVNNYGDDSGPSDGIYVIQGKKHVLTSGKR